MKYFKEYLGLVLLVIAVIAAEPLMAAFYEFTATQKKEGFAADRVPSGEYPREVDEPLLYPTYPKKAGPEYGGVLR